MKPKKNTEARPTFFLGLSILSTRDLALDQAFTPERPNGKDRFTCIDDEDKNTQDSTRMHSVILKDQGTM